MKKKYLALFCALAFALTGCSPNTADVDSADLNISNPNTSDTQTANTDISGESDKETESDTQQTDTESSANPDTGISLKPVTVTYEQASHTQYADGSTQELLYTDYQRPTVTVADNEKATSQINAYFTTEENHFYAGADNMYSSANEHFLSESENFHTYYVSTTYDTHRCDESILSIKQCFSTYMGGTHGDYQYTGINFDVTTGQKLSLDDICTDKDALLKTAKSYILSQLELPRYSEMMMDTSENISAIIDEYVLTDDTWYFTNSGITFVSNTYILGPYAAGAFFFTVPYQELDTLKPEYQYHGPFELAAPIGSNCSANLDGNEDIDAVYYDCSANWNTGEVTSTFTINGTDYSSYLHSEDCTLTDGAAYTTDAQYYIIDIDPTDEYREIAILDNGYSDDPVTYFFRYDRGDLTYLGCVYDLLNSPSCYINGDGTIHANQLLGLLETAKIAVTYELDGNSLKLVEQEWYYVDDSTYPETSGQHNILQDVIVYTENSQSSDTITLTPQDGPVSFPATDNEHWFMIKMPNEQIYYLYLEDFDILEDGRYTTDVFDNLFLAG